MTLRARFTHCTHFEHLDSATPVRALSSQHLRCPHCKQRQCVTRCALQRIRHACLPAPPVDMPLRSPLVVRWLEGLASETRPSTAHEYSFPPLLLPGCWGGGMETFAKPQPLGKNGVKGRIAKCSHMLGSGLVQSCPTFPGHRFGMEKCLLGWLLGTRVGLSGQLRKLNHVPLNSVVAAQGSPSPSHRLGSGPWNQALLFIPC